MGTSRSSVKGNSVILGRNNSRLQSVVGSNELKRKCRKGHRDPGGKDVCEPSMYTCNKEGQKCSGCVRKSYQQKVVILSPYSALVRPHFECCVLLGSPVQERHSHTGESPTKGH